MNEDISHLKKIYVEAESETIKFILEYCRKRLGKTVNVIDLCPEILDEDREQAIRKDQTEKILSRTAGFMLKEFLGDEK